MSNTSLHKQILLLELKILLNKTDEEHALFAHEIVKELAECGYDTDRKTVYRDMDEMRAVGIDVENDGKGYYLASRPLELQEMIMLVDAVQSAPFLTDKITDHLIKQIQQFASTDQRKMLSRRIDVPGRVKMQNEEVLLNIDIIQQAMREGKKIEYQYFAYDVKKKKVARKKGKTYIATPVKLVYTEEFYYLITFNDYWAEHDGNAFTPYRVDRMTHVIVSEEAATEDPRIKNFDLDEFMSPTFGMYTAEKTSVTLEIDQSAMNPIIDKFGVDALVFEKEDDRAQVYVKAPLSPQFFGWLMQLGPLVKIVKPKRAVEMFTKQLTDMQRMYSGQYRICSEVARRALTQEQFLELIGTLESSLKEHVKTLPAGGFENERAFIDYVWSVIDPWMEERGISDGLPTEIQKPIIVKGKKKIPAHPTDFEAYLSYGQAAGEAIIAIEPRKWAAKGCEDNFLDTVEHYGGLAGHRFVLIPPLNWGKWEKLDENAKAKQARKRCTISGDASFETWGDIDEEGNTSWHSKFTSDLKGFGEIEFEPWKGGRDDVSSLQSAYKYWQQVAYRFS